MALDDVVFCSKNTNMDTIYGIDIFTVYIPVKNAKKVKFNDFCYFCLII